MRVILTEDLILLLCDRYYQPTAVWGLKDLSFLLLVGHAMVWPWTLLHTVYIQWQRCLADAKSRSPCSVHVPCQPRIWGQLAAFRGNDDATVSDNEAKSGVWIA